MFLQTGLTASAFTRSSRQLLLETNPKRWMTQRRHFGGAPQKLRRSTYWWLAGGMATASFLVAERLTDVNSFGWIPIRSARAFWHSSSASTTGGDPKDDPASKTPATTASESDPKFSPLSPLHAGPSNTGSGSAAESTSESTSQSHQECRDRRCPGRIASVAQSVLESVVAVRVEMGS